MAHRTTNNRFIRMLFVHIINAQVYASSHLLRFVASRTHRAKRWDRSLITCYVRPRFICVNVRFCLYKETMSERRDRANHTENFIERRRGSHILYDAGEHCIVSTIETHRLWLSFKCESLFFGIVFNCTFPCTRAHPAGYLGRIHQLWFRYAPLMYVFIDCWAILNYMSVGCF